MQRDYWHRPWGNWGPATWIVECPSLPSIHLKSTSATETYNVWGKGRKWGSYSTYSKYEILCTYSIKTCYQRDFILEQVYPFLGIMKTQVNHTNKPNKLTIPTSTLIPTHLKLWDTTTLEQRNNITRMNKTWAYHNKEDTTHKFLLSQQVQRPSKAS